MRPVLLWITVLLLAGSCLAVTKPHVIIFGKPRTVEVRPDSEDGQPANPRPIKVRTLIVDGRPREYTTGSIHEVTDRYFVVQRAILLNDSLPQDSKNPQWIWRLSGWISIDRQTGRVSQLNLPAFDGDTSDASWYRDYAAYCGASDDGSKSYLVVSQFGKRKPVVRKEYSGTACAAPTWERGPSRVTFVAAGEKTSFVVHAHSADLQTDTTEEENQ
ncbi:MAG TPA: hypothetical protein VGN44_06615 [Candidatus Angelobacter sp.]|jgi:hypothetical protein